MSIIEIDIKFLVEDFLAKQDLRGHRYEFVKVVSSEKYPEEYSAVFNVYTLDNFLSDGPAVFIVNKNSKEVRVL